MKTLRWKIRKAERSIKNFNKKSNKKNLLKAFDMLDEKEVKRSLVNVKRRLARLDIKMKSLSNEFVSETPDLTD